MLSKLLAKGNPVPSCACESFGNLAKRRVKLKLQVQLPGKFYITLTLK